MRRSCLVNRGFFCLQLLGFLGMIQLALSVHNHHTVGVILGLIAIKASGFIFYAETAKGTLKTWLLNGRRVWILIAIISVSIGIKLWHLRPDDRFSEGFPQDCVINRASCVRVAGRTSNRYQQLTSMQFNLPVDDIEEIVEKWADSRHNVKLISKSYESKGMSIYYEDISRSMGTSEAMAVRIFHNGDYVEVWAHSESRLGTGFDFGSNFARIQNLYDYLRNHVRPADIIGS